MSRGFTLVEATLSLGIIGLVLTGGILLTFRNVSDTRAQDTLDKLTQIKRAIVGDPRIVTKESRTDFGFVGDVGNVPASLNNLWIQGSIPSFTFDATAKLGAGWQGPYVPIGPIEFFNDIDKDAWGNSIQYSAAIGTSATTGQQYNARLISAGPDGAVGTSDDLTLEIYENEMTSQVVGYVRDANLNPLPGVSAKINYPSSGVLASQSVQTDASGAYSFSNIPTGNRSVEIEPLLVFVSGSASTSPNNGQYNVTFTVQNFNASNVTFDSFKAEYSVSGGAWYESVRVGSTTVFSYTTNRAATGQLINFSGSPQTITGTGSISGATIPLRVQSAFSQVPDQNIGQSAAKGGSVQITIGNFKNAQSGSGSTVNMTGISFKVTLCSGLSCTTPSIAYFTP
jgi:hypothetical protein